MKKRLQGLIAGILIGTLLTGGTIFAKTGSEFIEAIYSNIKIYIDGVQIDPKDANGNTVEPFIYNGTTYLPVRAVGQAIGKTVSWDGATQSVYLGEKPGEKQYLVEVCSPYDAHNCTMYTNGKSFLMGGTKYTNGFVLSNGGWNKGDIYFNLNAKYKTIIMEVGPVDGTNYSMGPGERDWERSTLVSFYIDDELVEELIFEVGDLPQKVSIPVNYGMKLHITHDVRDGDVGFGNITAK